MPIKVIANEKRPYSATEMYLMIITLLTIVSILPINNPRKTIPAPLTTFNSEFGIVLARYLQVLIA